MSSKIIYMKDREYFFLLVTSIIVLLLLTSIPYFLAVRAAGEEYVFAGFLLNPLDSNTYLAKMYQGLQGHWNYSLPYTAELSGGAFISGFYLFMGHIARLTGWPLIIVFHLARLFSSVIMVIAIFHFIKVVVPDAAARSLAFILVVFGSGLGWVALITGRLTSDFWVAEAYPFLSAFTNPHFPLGIGLTLLLITPIVNWRKNLLQREWATPLLALALAIVYPFGVIVVVILLGMMVFWEQYLAADRSLPRLYHWRFLLSFVFGIPLLVYYLWSINTDPIFSAWNTQNITPSPHFGDFIISFSPLIIFLLPAIAILWKKKLGYNRVVLLWCVVGIILLCIPWNLQRRFIIGLYIPIVLLGIMGIYRLRTNTNTLRWVGTGLIVLSLPTNIVILLLMGQGIVTRNDTIYIHKDEESAFQWISKNTQEDAVIIAAPETGLFIPARTGRRVIYGHPFETVSAENQKERLTRFFHGSDSGGDLNPLEQGDYLFYGPRERELGNGYLPDGINLVYENGKARIYQVIR